MKKIEDSLFYCFYAGIIFLFVVAPSFLSAKEVILVEEDNGKAISVAIEDTLTINLVGNKSTGFSWKVASQDGTSLKFVEHHYTPFPSMSPIRVGAPGLSSFKFLAVSPGPSELKLIYSRSWEKGAPPAKVFRVFVDVGNENN